MSTETMKQALEVLEQINQLSVGENAIALPGEIDAAMDNLRAAIDGTPEFKSYAEYVTEAMPDVTLPVLRDMFKHNASVREYQEHQAAIEAKLKNQNA